MKGKRKICRNFPSPRVYMGWGKSLYRRGSSEFSKFHRPGLPAGGKREPI